MFQQKCWHVSKPPILPPLLLFYCHEWHYCQNVKSSSHLHTTNIKALFISYWPYIHPIKKCAYSKHAQCWNFVTAKYTANIAHIQFEEKRADLSRRCLRRRIRIGILQKNKIVRWGKE